MKGVCLSLGVALLIWSFSWIGTSCNPKEKSPARLHIEENHWNFGSVIVGERPNHVFTLKNVGGTALRIQRIESDCACTVANPSKTHLRPGETTGLKVSLNTEGRRGKLIQQVNIVSDDSISPTTSVTVEANIFPPFSVTPKYMHFSNIGEKTITVSSQRELKLQIERVESSAPRLSAVVSGSIVEGVHTLHTIKVNVNGDVPIEPLDVTETVTIHTNLPNHKKILIPVRIHLGQRISSHPAKLFFGVVSRGEERIRKATLSIPKQFGSQIEGAQCQESFLVPTVTRITSDTYQLNARLRSTAPVGQFQEEIEVRTTDPNIFLLVEAQGFIKK